MSKTPHPPPALTQEQQWLIKARYHVVERLTRSGLVDFTPAADTIVFHYTDVHAMMAILEHKKLRASSVTHLNDTMEGRLGTSRFVDAILACKEETIARIKSPLLDELTDEQQQLCRRFEVFNCSFSYNGDLLSQWRGYANDGMGYAIGFDARALAQYLRPLGWTYTIVYDEAEQHKIAETALNALGEWFTRNVTWMDREAHADLIQRFAYGTISVLSPMMKHAGFSEEAEFRHVVNNQFNHLQGSVRVRARNGAMVPYVELTTERDIMGEENGSPVSGSEPVLLPIRRIVVGPCQDFAREEHCLHLLLDHHGFHDVEVEPSKLPYLPRNLSFQ